MRVFHARVKDADACVFDTQARFTRAFWAAYLRPVLYFTNYIELYEVRHPPVQMENTTN